MENNNNLNKIAKLTDQNAIISKQYRQTAVFPFERDFDPLTVQRWATDNYPVVLTISVVYLLSVYFGRLYMKNRKPYDLKIWLARWSAFLAAFSLLAFIRMVPEFWHALHENGLHYSVCDNTYMHIPEFNVWFVIFTFSKMAEFIDTFFIVARNRPLIVLHWYHHALTLIYSWHAYVHFIPTSRWSLVMNSFVHFIMYGYYSFRTIGYRIPKYVSIAITTLQTVQMFVGCWINLIVLRIMNDGAPCDMSRSSLYFNVIVYFTYLILFCKFFYTSYVIKSTTEKAKVKDD